jgi:pilus assembly protein CpaF
MSFFGNRKQLNPAPAVLEADDEPPAHRSEDHYSDLTARRPGLIEERLKLHALIIDEFNLAALDKLPPDELSRQVRTYVGNYARDGSLSLNQKELDISLTPCAMTKRQRPIKVQTVGYMDAKSQ